MDTLSLRAQKMGGGQSQITEHVHACSEEFLRWTLQPPGYLQLWCCRKLPLWRWNNRQSSIDRCLAESTYVLSSAVGSNSVTRNVMPVFSKSFSSERSTRSGTNDHLLWSKWNYVLVKLFTRRSGWRLSYSRTVLHGVWSWCVGNIELRDISMSAAGTGAGKISIVGWNLPAWLRRSDESRSATSGNNHS